MHSIFQCAPYMNERHASNRIHFLLHSENNEKVSNECIHLVKGMAHNNELVHMRSINPIFQDSVSMASRIRGTSILTHFL